MLQLLHLAEGGEAQDFTYGLCGSPVHTLSVLLGRLEKKITLYFVKAAGDKGEDVWQNEGPVTVKFVNSGEDTQTKICGGVATNYDCKGENFLWSWSFIPFNWRYDKRLKKIADNLRERGIDADAKKNFDARELWQDPEKREAIREAFGIKGSNPNMDSMTLYSGAYIDDRKIKFCLEGTDAATGEAHHGCLYTGDYTAANQKAREELMKNYQGRLDTIGTVQLPHHGANSCFSPEMVDAIDAKYYVATLKSSEIHDKYREALREHFEQYKEEEKSIVYVTEPEKEGEAEKAKKVFGSTVMGQERIAPPVAPL